ncbi:discoidin domain-containing protein [Streptomyces lasiicapitis]|uniref:Glycosyl hydrolase n=1 Tax=Streptomyces lasiicapitis TaxID=1923961 RepID=A0ABQ2LKE9_9ACTN|nr:discoidin domain-containing protein [Streptomyces lasiicapitis]GGO34520.1 glycosyl hydrolase [Streptomyces lasiicapitis]
MPAPLALTSALLASALAAAALPQGPATPDTTPPQPPRSACPAGPWAPTSTTRAAPDDPHLPYVGNGYLGARVAPAGTGYVAHGGKTGWPLYTPAYAGTFASGLYARGPENTAGREAIAALPTWTPLDLTVGGETYGPRSRVSHYRQTLHLRCGFVRTSLTWTTADGRRTDLTYDVLADRTHAHTAAVRLSLTPHWSGGATVTDRVDGRGARRVAHTGGGARGKNTMDVTFRTDGTRTDGAVASTLRAPGRTHQARPARDLSVSQSADFGVRAGGTYHVTKYVGVDTELTSGASGAAGASDTSGASGAAQSPRTSRTPREAARDASVKAAARGWDALFAAHTAAWRTEWDTSSIEIPSRPDLQLWVRSSQYGLLSSLRRGARDSIAPTGLTSDNYAGMVFWDAETWMFPALLASRPELARPVLDYRGRTAGAARDNARKTSVKGLFYPWTSASRGRLWTECQSWYPPHCVQQNHLQGDIALAAWQYYLATGDRAWLRAHGWPLLRGIAEYWAGRTTRNPDGSYSIQNVAGPDEYSNGVTDGVYTNAVAATALRAATGAARALGRPAPADWTRQAERLRIPYDPKRKIFLQYDGYKGSTIKQADTVLLIYPLDWPMPEGAAAATLDYYAERSDPDGPAMTDSVHAIDAAAIGEPGCSSYTYLQRASRPFVRGPFALFSEARGEKAGAGDALAGTPAQDFLTGKGGFLQVFTHGLTGLRLRDSDALRLDPTLPPQLGSGVTLRGQRWRGSTYDIAVGPDETTVTLTAGHPFTVESPQGRVRVERGAPGVLATRRPDRTPTADAARCRPATATSEDSGLYAAAAVDGSDVTAWSPAAKTRQATLTVDLGREVHVRDVTARWGVRPADFAVETSGDGREWGAPGSGPARFARVTVRVGERVPELRELRVSE